MEMLGEALRGIGNTQTWLIASAGTLEWAQQGLFAKAFCEALERPAIGPSQQFIGLDSLVQAINDANAGQGEQQARVFPPPTGSTGIPPFFINKDFVSDLAGLTVDEQHWLSRVRSGPEETTDGWYLTGKEGRILAAQHLVTWMTDPGQHELAVVTGSPGTGKSTLLSLPVLLTERSRRKDLLRTAGTDSLIQRTADLLPASTQLVAVHARGLNTNQAAGLLARALGRDGHSADALLRDLDAKPVPGNRVVVVDAADEATSPATLLGGLVVPLSRQPGIRVVLGARRHVLPDVPEAALSIDLDASKYRDPRALSDYVYRLLVADQEPGVTTAYQRGRGEAVRSETAQVAAAIARRATSRDGVESFLLGRLFALSARGRATRVDVTSADWQAELPGGIAEAFEEDLARLGGKRPVAQALLMALAWAKGPGLPWEGIWATVAEAISRLNVDTDFSITNEDVRWLLTTAGAYIVEDRGPGERSVYRPFHDLLAAYLRGEPTAEDRQADEAAAVAWEKRRSATEETITRELLATTVARHTGRPNWWVAHPYLRTYLAEHAAAAGAPVLAVLARDSNFLAVADPLTLTPLLLPTIPELRNTARIYRRARPQFEEDPRANIAYLLEAARIVTGTAGGPASPDIEPLYRTRFAIVRGDDSLLTLTGHTDAVNSVAFGTTAEGQLLLASASDDAAVRLWDPVTGTLAREPLTGHTDAVNSVAFGTTAEGQLLLASASDDAAVRLWDPVTGTLAREPLTGHTDAVNSVAFGTTAEGQLLLASASDDAAVRLWDPVTGTLAREPLTGHTRAVNSVAFGTTAEGQLLLASASDDKTVRLWDPVRGTFLREFLTDEYHGAISVAFGTTSDGCVFLAYSDDNGRVRICDIAKAYRASENISHFMATAVAFGKVKRQLLLATASSDGTVELWDPVTGAAVGQTLSGHTGGVTSVAFGAIMDGQLAVASASDDGTVRVWDPVDDRTRAQDPILRITSARTVDGYPGRVKSVALGNTADRRLSLASASGDGRIWLWDPDTRTRMPGPIVGHTGGVTSVAFGATADGRLLLASASDDGKVWLWDTVTRSRIGKPLIGHTEAVTSVAFGATADGRLLLASASSDNTVRLWDPTTGPVASLIGHTGRVTSVAFGRSTAGRLLLASAGMDRTVRVWDPIAGTRIGQPLIGHARGVSAVAFGTARAGRLLLASAGRDGTLRLWDPLAATSVGKPLTGHTDVLTSLAISDITGQQLLIATASDDGTVRLWDPGSRAHVGLFRRRSRVKSIAAIGRMLAIGDDEGVSVIEPMVLSEHMQRPRDEDW